MKITAKFGVLFVALHLFSIAHAKDGFFQLKEENGRVGIIFNEKYSKKEKWVLPAEYDSIIEKTGGLNPWFNGNQQQITKFFYVLYKGGKTGLFRHGTEGDSEILLKCQYDQINVEKGIGAIRKGALWGLYNGFKNNWMLQNEYDSITLDSFGENYSFHATATQKGKTGLFSIFTNSWLLSPEYEEALIKPGQIVLTRKGNQRGVFYHHAKGIGIGSVQYWILNPGAYSSIVQSKSAIDFLIVDSLGKKGIWYNNSSAVRGECIIPLHYSEIGFMSIKLDTDTYLLTDSLGRKGLWKHIAFTPGANMLIEAGYDDIFYNEKQAIIIVSLGGQQGLYDRRTGWKSKPSAGFVKLLNYQVFGSKMAIGYTPGKGFGLSCDAGGESQSVFISDQILYDSFGLANGNLLLAFKSGRTNLYYLHFKKVIRGHQLTGSQLLAQNMEACCGVYPQKINQANMLIENQAIVYSEKGKLSWWKVGELGASEQSIIKISMEIDQLDDHFSKNPYESMGSSLMLVANKKNFGIINLDGQLLVPMAHPAFKVVNNATIRFQSPVRGKFRLFSAQAATKLSASTMDPEWKALEWCSLNGKKTGDFDSILQVNNRVAIKVDTGWYYLQNATAKHTRVLYEGDITHRFTHGNAQFEIIEQFKGVGLRRNGNLLIPIALQQISTSQEKITMTDKRLTSIEIPLKELGDPFNLSKGFKVYNSKKHCPECKGTGGSHQNVTRKIPAKTTYTTRETVSTSPTYERVWDTKTNQYQNVKSTKTTTTTQSIPHTTPARTEITREYVSCKTCKNTGQVPGFDHYSWKNGFFDLER